MTDVGIDWAKKAEEDLAHEPEKPFSLRDLFHSIEAMPIRPSAFIMSEQDYEDICAYSAPITRIIEENSVRDIVVGGNSCLM